MKRWSGIIKNNDKDWNDFIPSDDNFATMEKNFRIRKVFGIFLTYRGKNFNFKFMVDRDNECLLQRVYKEC